MRIEKIEEFKELKIIFDLVIDTQGNINKVGYKPEFYDRVIEYVNNNNKCIFLAMKNNMNHIYLGHYE